VQSSVTPYRAQQQLQQATLLHQAHHLRCEARQRAAKAGAAHAARDGHTSSTGASQLGHAAHAGAAHPALTDGLDRDYFSQVQADLAAGKFADALGLLDRHWPAGAHTPGMQEARASIAHVIVARLQATLMPLKPLTMYDMLVALAKVGKPRLDEALTGGHRLRDLLLAAAHGLDRLAYPTVPTGGQTAGPHPSPSECGQFSRQRCIIRASARAAGLLSLPSVPTWHRLGKAS